VRFLLDADYAEVAKEIEKYLKWKKIHYTTKKYSKPKMIKFKLGIIKSITVAQIGKSTFVKAPAELYDVLAQFKTKAIFGKLLDREGAEFELLIFEAKEEAAKKTLALILALTLFATVVVMMKNLLPYSMLLIMFSFLPVRVKVKDIELDVSAYPILYPYYALQKKRMKRIKESEVHF
jgi:hypothetical protein